MYTSIFITLPVANISRSREFFGGLGFTFNEDFSDEETTCMIVTDTIMVMLGEHKKYESLIDKPVAASSTSEVIVSLACSTREEILTITSEALSRGARQVNEPEDLGFMFSWGFEDLDGHLWNFIWMNPEFEG